MTALLVAALIAAAPLDSVFNAANDAYEKGDPAESARILEQLAAEGVEDAAVFYNLGNAYFALERNGAAIANYDRALALDPAFADAAFNRDQARAKSQRGLQPPLAPAWEQSILFWDDGWSAGTIMTLLAAANALFWAVLAIRLWRPVRYTRMAALAAGLCVAAFALSAWARSNAIPIAYAVSETVPVRYGPGPGENVRFDLYDGDAVVIEDRRPGWLRVRTIDGEQGWAVESDILPVGPPYAPAPAREETGDA